MNYYKSLYVKVILFHLWQIRQKFSIAIPRTKKLSNASTFLQISYSYQVE